MNIQSMYNPINTCKFTELTIFCNRNPTFSLYFMMKFQFPDTKKGIIFQHSSGKDVEFQSKLN